MRKQVTTMYNRKTVPFFSLLDTFLLKRIGKIITLVILTAIYSLTITNKDILQSILLAIYTIWLYLSCQKYGLLDTIEFSVILPFLFVFELMKLIPGPQKKNGSIDFETFAEQAKIWLNDALNDIYSGTIVETRIEDERIYILVETPYGLHVPEKEILKAISDHLHISPKHVMYETITDRRNYYIFGKEAVEAYENYRTESTRFKSFSEIKERLLLQSPTPTLQSPQVQKII